MLSGDRNALPSEVNGAPHDEVIISSPSFHGDPFEKSGIGLPLGGLCSLD